MKLQHCCDTTQLIWETKASGKRFVDRLSCVSCDHVHKEERWFAPLAWTSVQDCLNCGTQTTPQADDSQCSRCQHTPTQIQTLHAQLAALHPQQDPVQAAEMAMELGRCLLALKLSTYALVRDYEQTQARVIRLKALETLGFVSPALDEAWQWVDRGAPADVWEVIAVLEGSRGNIDGAILALERGLKLEPNHCGMWIDYAEILAHSDNRPHAVYAAGRALPDPKTRSRAAATIVAMATRYLKEDLVTPAVKALNLLGDLQEQMVEAAWLRVLIAHHTRQPQDGVKWVRVVLSIDPNHAQALALAKKFNRTPTPVNEEPTPKETPKRRWLPWSS